MTVSVEQARRIAVRSQLLDFVAVSRVLARLESLRGAVPTG